MCGGPKIDVDDLPQINVRFEERPWLLPAGDVHRNVDRFACLAIGHGGVSRALRPVMSTVYPCALPPAFLIVLTVCRAPPSLRSITATLDPSSAKWIQNARSRFHRLCRSFSSLSVRATLDISPCGGRRHRLEREIFLTLVRIIAMDRLASSRRMGIHGTTRYAAEPWRRVSRQVGTHTSSDPHGGGKAV